MKFKAHPTPRRLRRAGKRRLLVQNLEDRHLLAVDGFTIDLSGGGDVDLFDAAGGGVIQQGYFNGIGGGGGAGGGGSIGTSNVPGSNNELPIPGDDTAAANEDGPAITINVADLLANDTDPDNSGTLSIIAVSNTGTLGHASLDLDAGTITYDPNGAFESLAHGQTTTDTFYYSVDDSKFGRSVGRVIVTVTGSNDAPTVSGVATVTATEGSTATHTGTYAEVDSGDTTLLTASEGTLTDHLDGTWSWSLATTDEAATRSVTITATDGQTASNDFTFQFTVTNVAPSIALTGSGSVVEGSVFELTLGGVTDPGDDTVTGYTIDWGDGSPIETPVTAGLKTHTYADGPNDYTITVSVVDEDGTQTAGTHTVTVNNAAPVVGADNASVTVNEGVTANNTGTFSDVGDDTVVLSASIGTITDNLDGTWSWSFASTDGPTESQTVTITATDSDSVATTATFDLIVNNVAPAVASNNATVTVNEGQTASNAGTYSDASGDTVTLTADFGTITDNLDGTWSWSYDSTDGPDESQTVTITATDNDSAVTTTSFNLVVNNVAPVAAALTIDVLGNVPITRAWSTLLVGATDAGNDLLSVESIDSTTGVGTLTFDNVAETFRYVPQVGYEGTTTFLFTIADSDGATHQQTATISIEKSLWIVDNSAAPGGDGSLALPFQDFTALNDVETDPDADASGDLIFVVGTGTPYDVTHGVHNDGGFHLEDDQILLGSGLTGTTLQTYLADIGISVPAGSDALPAINAAPPTITNTTGDVLTVSTGNTIAGVTLDPVASAGIAGDNAGNLVIEFTIIITSGGTNNNEGIRLRNVTGTITIKSTDIGSADGQTNAGTAIQIDGGTADIQFDDLDIDQDGGSLLEILNTAASTIEFDDNSELTLQGSDKAAVTITGNTGGTVTLNNAGFSADTTATVKFNITGNTGLKATTPVNDAPEFVLASSVHNSLEDGGPQSVTAFATDVTPGPDPTESDQEVVFSILSNDNEALFAVLPQLDANGNLTYTIADGALGTANITVNLSDDGGTADGGMDTSESQTFSIEVVPVNDAPSFVLLADPATVAEDAGPQTIAGFASSLSPGPANESAQLLSFEVTDNTNASLFAVAPAINAAGELTYTPADNVTGSATLTVVLHDDGGTDHGGVDTSPAHTFVITVAPPINDAPTFTLVNPTFTAEEDAGPQSAAGFVSEISAGAADEATQTLTFDVIGNSNPALFSAAPTIDSSGNLTFTSAENAHGTATLTVTLRDSGGTDNGGVDTSLAKTITISVNSVNDAPVLAEITNPTTDELATLSFTATATDIDVPADTLTFSLAGSVPSGANISAEGVFSWTPVEAEGAGTYTFDVVVSDGDLEDRQTIIVSVAEVNVAPALDSIGDLGIDEGSELTFTATATDPDLPANTLTFSLSGNVPAGATISQSGEFSWTPSETQGPGSYSFDVTVSDGSIADAETITITVADVNNAPVLALIGNQTGSEHQLLTFTATATDSDLPADTLTFSLSGSVPAGASISETGVFSWTPGEDQDGVFGFDVVVSDGQSTHYETVTWTISEVNDPPVLGAIGNHVVDEQQSLTFTATATDADVPHNPLTFSLSQSAPATASITSEGVFTWTPTEIDGGGIFTFDVLVSDGTTTDSETITVTVNEVNTAPVLAEIGDQSIAEHQAFTFTATATDSDVPVDTLTFSLVGSVPTGASITESGEFSWTPAEDQDGDFEFDIVVSDGQSTDYETVTWTIAEVNDAPVLDVIGDQAVDEGQPLTFTATATDADLSPNTLTFSLSLSAPVTASITPEGVFNWTPTELDGGNTFTFDVLVSDGTTTDSESITVTVNETNSGPDLADIADQSIAEHQVAIFIATATDADLPQNTLTFSLNGNVPAGASITPQGVFSWTPTEFDGGGTFTFDVIVSDGTTTDSDTLTITVSESNTAPVLASIGDQSITEHQAFTLTATAADIDLPTDSLTFSLSGSVPTGASITESGVFSWTPGEDQDGIHAFDIVVSDGQSSTYETVTWTIAEVNDPPVLDAVGNHAIDEGHSLTFTATATDADLAPNTLTFSLGQSAPATASITPEGVFSWTPAELDGGGSFTFDVLVSDGTMTDSETIAVTVNKTNTAPVLTGIGAQNFAEHQAFTFTATAIDIDLPIDTLTFSLSGNVPAGASITESGVFSWTPGEGQDGVYEFDIEVSDGQSSTYETVTWTISEVNDPPVLDAIGAQNLSEGVPHTFTATASDADAPSQTLTFSLAGNVPTGASISPEGVFTWTPAEDQQGTFEFDVVVSDGHVNDVLTITCNVAEVNQAPVLAAFNDLTVNEGQYFSLNFTATDSDLPSNDVTLSIVGRTAGTWWIIDEGTLTGPATYDDAGTYIFDITATDNGSPALTDTQTITITVNDVQPVLVLQGDTTGSFGGGSASIGGVDFTLEGVALGGGTYRAEYQPIGNDQEVASTVYEDLSAVQASHSVFDPTGETQQAWRVSLTDLGGANEVTATRMQVTLAYNPALLDVLENDIHAFQWDAANSAWNPLTVLARDTSNHTLTVESDVVHNIVLGVPQVINLQAATAAANDVCHAALSVDQLRPIVNEAIARLAATGIGENQIEQLRSTAIEIVDLSDNVLGATIGDAIQIDINAANHGWFIDPTPSEDDDEFGDSIDLLTVILHEMQHVLGEDHSESGEDLMNAILPTGTRRLPESTENQSLAASLVDEALTGLLDD